MMSASPILIGRLSRSLATLLGLAGFAAAALSQENLLMEEFRPRASGTGQTLFATVPPERTGVAVRNSYEDPRMWGERYQEMVFGTIGTGVAVADYDSDGRVDIFVAGKTGDSRLYRNLGNWRFEDVTESAGVSRPKEGRSESLWGLFGGGDEEEETKPWDQGTVFADVNNDGLPDLYVSSFAAPNRLYINQGDGTFREEAAKRGLDIVDGSGVAAFYDYDRNGSLDLYLQTNIVDAATGPEGRPDYLFRNDGNGYFTNVTEAAGISGVSAGHSVTWWDFNEDGWPDIYVANDFSGPDRLYQNNGDGTFSDVLFDVVPRTPYYAMGSDFGDVNNDGRFDLLVADMAPTTHEKDLRGMAVSRARELGNHSEQAAHVRMRNALYIDTGVGRMLEAAHLAGVANTDWTWSVRFEDFDCDGRIDLHVTNGMVREYHNVDILNRIMGSMNRMAQRGIMRSSPPLSEANLAYRNHGGLEFEEVGAAWGLDQIGVSFGMASGDFDGDGDLDLVVVNYDAPPTLLRNDVESGNRAVFALRGAASNRFGVGATVRLWSESGEQVRQLSLARGYLSSSEPVLHFGLGSDKRIERATVRWPSGRLQSFTDLPVNRRFTVTEPRSGSDAPPAASPTPSLFEESGEALGLSLDPQPGRPERRQPLAPFGFSRIGPSLASIDLLGDGAASLLVGSSGGDPTRLLTRDGDGRFSPAAASLPWNGLADGPIVVADFDGNGLDDALVTKASGSPVLLLNAGGGVLSMAPSGWLPSMVVFAGAAAAADFEGGGLPGVFVGSRARPGRYPQGGRSYLLANRGGRFEDVSELLAPGGELGMVTAAVWADADGDGWQDLVLAEEWGAVRYFRSLGGAGFEELTEEAGFASAGHGLWSCLATGDFNGDGRADFAAGNLGLNTPYRASSEEPVALYWGEFGGRGPFQLVEALHDERGRLVPRRSRGELGEEIPAVLRRFASNDAYATATLEEVLGADALGRAVRLEATELRSGIFLSSPDGSYRFEPFERLAQVAPIQSLAAGDFDGDGNLDLAAAQNLFDVDPAIGRFDGGLGQLLLGDGRGGFSAAEPASSGLVAPGDGQATLAVDLDGDGRLDLLLSRSGSPLLVFLNRSGEEAK